jgi:hypothetical protein
MVIDPEPVAGLNWNFSSIPRIAPPPVGNVKAGARTALWLTERDWAESRAGD